VTLVALRLAVALAPDCGLTDVVVHAADLREALALMEETRAVLARVVTVLHDTPNEAQTQARVEDLLRRLS
jgi:hypothetical protein